MENQMKYDPERWNPKMAEFMGFESDEKWKAVRYTIYALVGGYLLGDVKDQIFDHFTNPFSNL